MSQEDAWDSYRSQMEDRVAFVSFNASYAGVASEDPRVFMLRVRLKFRTSTPQGLSASEEFPQLTRVEDELAAAVVARGGVQVGRVSGNGQRIFFFYVGFGGEQAAEIVDRIAAQAGYPLQHLLDEDTDKRTYWEQLWPSVDERQVLADTRVLGALRQHGDDASIPREVAHWANFPSQPAAQAYAAWVAASGYAAVAVEAVAGESGRFVVRFSHHGSMMPDAISGRTVPLKRKAGQLGGDYDGWETSIQR